MDDLALLANEFATEALGLVERLDRCLVALEGDLPPEAREALLAPVQRHLHTLKGNAGFIGATPLQDALHRLEDVASTLTHSPAAATWLLSALSLVREDLQAIGAGRAPTEAAPGLLRIAQEEFDGEADASWEAGDRESVRVPQFRLDELISTTSDLWVQHAHLVARAQVVPEVRPAVERLTPVVRRLQSLALSVRLQAFRPLQARLERLVRDESRRCGKQAELVVHGAELEVDKGVLDACSTCLVHLVRNALAHGLESPQERVAAGKPAAGQLTIAVSQQAGLVRIQLADDGKGLDPAAIRAKAEARGLDPRRPAEALIFEAGLSTTSALGQLSGRGVGLDAVRSVARAAGGTVEVSSRPGNGCLFTLVLPASLALQRALLVELGGERYALPAVSVFHTARTADLSVRRLGSQRWIEQPGRLVPFVDTRALLGLSARTGAYTVLFEANGLGALEVDLLGGHQDFVFRSLDSAWLGPSPISGATLAASGDVLLRLDPSRLVAATLQTPSAQELS